MDLDPHTVVPAVESSQPAAVRFAARQLADRAGFNETDSYRAGLVATELATNLVKHASAGQVLMRVACDEGVSELELLAVDRGPGMANPSASLVDGYSTAGSPGTGLGAVRRLSDEFDIYSGLPRGTVVLAHLRPRPVAVRPARPLVVAGLSVAMAGEVECGDMWSLARMADGGTVLVADGLGHGPLAAEAAGAVVRTFRDRASAGCADVLEAVHGSVRHTRGAAAAVARISRSTGLLTYAGVGNIGARVVTDGVVRNAVSHNGTLGHQARHFREYAYPWSARALLVMHSDGLGTHWSLEAYPGLQGRHPALVAAVLFRDFARGRDDVTVLVAREAA